MTVRRARAHLAERIDLAENGPAVTMGEPQADLFTERGGAAAGSGGAAYQIDDGELVILVVKVGDRRDVYRNL